MTPEQAEAGFVELHLPGGGRVLVCFRGEVAANPDVEAAVVQMMLAATGSEADVRSALADYAESSGLTAVRSRDHAYISIEAPKRDISAEGEDRQVYGG
jgi:hypothetical protein